MIEFEIMEIILIIAILSCMISSLILAFSVWVVISYYRQKAEAEKKLRTLENKIAIISRSTRVAHRESWLVEIKYASYGSELEVEAKFVYPLMRHLGFETSDLRMRVGIAVRVGRQNVGGIADWVVYRDGKPIMVIETKEKNQNLDEQVQEQARSYCFALNCPTYLLTNGRQLRVYRRGVDGDAMVFNCEAQNLSENWDRLFELIGVA